MEGKGVMKEDGVFFPSELQGDFNNLSFLLQVEETQG